MSTRHHGSAATAQSAVGSVRRITFGVLAGALAVVALTFGATPATAQLGGGSVRSPGWLEVRPFAGAFIGTGDQRDLLDDELYTGLQASWRILPVLAVTGTFGWSPNQDRLRTVGEKLDVFQYDVGVEARAASLIGNGSVDFSPFVGLGLGGRTYSYRDLDADSQTHFNGYGAVGGDVGFGRIGVRVEGRDYVSRFKPLTGGGDAEARNDLTLAAGLYYRF